MWILATRGRPNNCNRFIEDWIATKADSPVYVRVDNDDPALEEILKLDWPKQFSVNVGPRARLGECMQEMFTAFPNEPWYGMLGDDLLQKTEHWDRSMIEAAGNNDISSANDVHEKRIRIIHPCVGGDLVRLVGFFAVPGCKHFCVDTFWEEVHHYFNRGNQLRDVILEHAHVNFGQAVADKTFVESQSLRSQDEAVFKEWKAANWDRLIDLIQTTYQWEPK